MWASMFYHDQQNLLKPPTSNKQPQHYNRSRSAGQYHQNTSEDNTSPSNPSPSPINYHVPASKSHHEHKRKEADSTDSNSEATKAMSDIVDLEEIVQRWAWQGFEYTKSKEQAKIPKEFLSMKVDWKYVKFSYEAPSYDIAPVAHPGEQLGHTQPQCVFKTTFSNVTNQGQEYSFKTERRTCSMATVAVEKGFTAGAEFGMKLQTPCEVLEASAGFKREMTVMNVEEDTVEEELTWGVDSVVRVPPGFEATAELVITEAQTKGSFKMRASMRGRVLVSLTNMRDNNCLVTVMEGDVSEIILREIERGAKNFRVEKNRTVMTEVVGKVHFKFGIEQRVVITEQPVTHDGRKSPRLPSPHRSGGTSYLGS